MLSAATKAFVCANVDADVRALALHAAPEGVNLHAALQQIVGLQIARRKLPAWAACSEIVYPVRLSMEQCSSQQTAEYKRCLVQRLAGSSVQRFADLTGGLGIDFSFISPLFGQAIYIERDEALCALARNNFAALGLHNVQVVNGDAEQMLATLTHQSLVFVDPARRDMVGRKVFLVADCSPDVVALHDALLAKADMVIIKLSPMLDIYDAIQSMPAVREVHVVEADGECKELLLVLRHDDGGGSVKIVATDTQKEFVFTREEENSARPTMADALGKYLYEPSPSVMKAGAFRTLSERFDVHKLHRDTHLYTSDRLIDSFPGRILRVCATSSLKRANTLLKDIDRANIVCRNFPQRPDELRRRLRLKSGDPYFVYATTLADNTHSLILAMRLA